MEIIKLKETGMDYAIEKANEVLQNGGVIAYPSDTIYGLGALYNNEEAVKRIIRLKGRPETKGILLIAGSIDSLKGIIEDLPKEAARMANKFWPGPLTLVLRARADISELITGGTGKVAVRIPGASFALELLRRKALIITSTSANPADLPPATDADTISRYFPQGLDLIVDNGILSGPPSTIVEIEGNKINVIREGAISSKEIRLKV